MTFVSFRRHRAVNLFLQGYERVWLQNTCGSPEDRLIEDLAVRLCCPIVLDYHLSFFMCIFIPWTFWDEFCGKCNAFHPSESTSCRECKGGSEAKQNDWSALSAYQSLQTKCIDWEKVCVYVCVCVWWIYAFVWFCV